MENNVIELPTTVKSNLKTMNYERPVEVMKDFLRNVFRPGIAKMNCDIGDKVLLTGREYDENGEAFAVGMIGVIKSEKYLIERTTGRPAGKTDMNVGACYDVEWKDGPIEIDPDYTCVQSGFISLDDRAEILAQLI